MAQGLQEHATTTVAHELSCSSVCEILFLNQGSNPSPCIAKVLVAQSYPTLSYPTLCSPMDCSPSCSSVCGILQARILEWVANTFSRESPQPRDWTWVSHIAGRFLITGPPRKSPGLTFKVWKMERSWSCKDEARQENGRCKGPEAEKTLVPRLVELWEDQEPERQAI